METSSYDLFVNNINNQNILKLLDIVKNIGDTDINRCFESDTSKHSDLKNNAGKISITLLSWSVLDVERLPITLYLLEKDVVDINKTNPLWLSIYSDNLFVARLLLNKNSINVNNSRFHEGVEICISEMALAKLAYMVSYADYNFLHSTNIFDLIGVCYKILSNKHSDQTYKYILDGLCYTMENKIKKIYGNILVDKQNSNSDTSDHSNISSYDLVLNNTYDKNILVDKQNSNSDTSDHSNISSYDLVLNNTDDENILVLLTLIKNIDSIDINRYFELDVSEYPVYLKNSDGTFYTTLLSWSVLDVKRLPITIYLLEKDIVDINKANPLWLSIYSDNLFAAMLLLEKKSINVNSLRYYRGMKLSTLIMALNKLSYMVDYSDYNFIHSTNIFDLIDVCYKILSNKHSDQTYKYILDGLCYNMENKIKKNSNTLVDNYAKDNISSGFHFNPLTSRIQHHFIQ